MTHRCWLLPTKRFLLATFSFFLIHSGSGTVISPFADKQHADGHKSLVDWVNSNGGRVDERLVMGFANHGHIRGVMALSNIEANTEILFFPWKLVLGTEGDTSKVLSGGHCDVLASYADQVRAGKNSVWHSYLAMDDSLGSRIPTVWHKSALKELQGLPPFEKTTRPSLVDWYVETCAEGKPFSELDAAARQSLHAAITRAASMRFLPLYDLMNHDNGNLNTVFLADKHGVRITTAVDIATGLEILVSYRGGTATSSDMFERYGFVEPYPQQWAWIDGDTSTEHRFLLLPKGVVIIGPLPEDMTAGIGTVVQPLSHLLFQAKAHNMKLSLGAVKQFAESAQSLLASLPTTPDEDKAIISDLEHRLLVDSGKSKSDSVIELQWDIISAVMYRKCFKEAIATALEVAEDIMKKEETGEQDL